MNARLPEERIVAILQAELAGLLGVWLFGSQANGHANAESDVDFAVLVAGKADPLQLWDISQKLAAVTQLPITVAVIRDHLDDFLVFSSQMLGHSSAG
ncbi:nucleotidyltransferase domain-containing protein [Pseudoduganella umbonata]|uniref:Nucleotidyltransferase domain-containing protein n=1 Tax=Pseudoduganella umbonata TaxID=864828 RepID=A0A4P8HTK0_9BURK|nr:nucleotidyltransferase domain-containing protein [Pseudoduganella umbonata]MBB3220446.1 putative nucleotidyltransferase [Pseudoduganella umbonata]QCP12028.1 nucleotidyltransferase domain-containing protein [Pseudoduganella umbonata]